MGRWSQRHPDVLPNPLPIYDQNERYPGRMRISFGDGTTHIYTIQPRWMPIRETLRRIRFMGREDVGYKQNGR